jgi:CarD family transcriptional regulator
METEKAVSEAPAFKVNQHVVYPLQGVGIINEIQERVLKGKKTLYYVIYLELSDMTVMIPTDKTEERGIRAIVPPKEAKKALTLIGEEFEPITADWKMRYQMHLDLLRSGSIHDIAMVVRALYHRSKVKELPIQERKLFDDALKILIDEITYSLKKPKSDAEEMIFARLETD